MKGTRRTAFGLLVVICASTGIALPASEGDAAGSTVSSDGAAKPNVRICSQPTAPAVQTGQVPVTGGALHYEVRGAGSPVVLLHAGGLDMTMWDPQVERLAESFRVVRYDSRGHGRSTARLGPHALDEDLRAVLDHLGIEQAHLVGISMGAGAALDFATRHPERVITLVLASTSGPPPGVPRQPGASPPLTLAAGRERLKALSMPRVLIVGEKDTPDHLRVADQVEAEVPEVRVVRLAGGAHVVNRDVPEAFNEVLLRTFK